MKKIISIFGVFALLAALVSCKDDDAKVIDTQAPVVGDLEETSFTLPDAGVDNYLFRLTWSKAKFFASGEATYVDGVEYTVQAALADGNFNDPLTVTTTGRLYLDIYTETLRTVHDALAGADNEDVISVALRVKADGAGKIFYSEPVMLTIRPFEPVPVLTDVEESTIATGESTYTLWYQGDNNPKAFTVTWDATKFYFDESATPTAMSPLTYTLQMDMSGNGFLPASTQTLASGVTALSADIYNNTLNAIMVDTYHAPAKQAYNVDLRLVINYGTGDAAGTAYSNTLTLTIIPFAPFNMQQPVYIFGSINGWNNSDPAGMYPMFKTSSADDNSVYTFTGYFPADSHFKFMPAEALNSWTVFSINGPDTFEYAASEGGAIYNELAGFKTVTINVKTMTYSVTDFATPAGAWSTMGLIGPFCGWDWASQKFMTKFSTGNNHLWYVDWIIPTLSQGWGEPFKVVADDGTWWYAVSDSEKRYGQTVKFVTGVADISITIRDVGTYRVWFNDLTGHYWAHRTGE